MHDVLLVGSAFLASAVEMVEAMTIILAVGITRGWRSALVGAAGALTALAIVTVAGVIVHRPLSNVPENAIKFSVGLMLMAFGTFWGAEGVGITWSLDAASILLIGGFYWLVVLIAMLKRSALPRAAAPAEAVL